MSPEPGGDRAGHPKALGSPLQRPGHVSSPQDTRAPPGVPGPHSKQAFPGTGLKSSGEGGNGGTRKARGPQGTQGTPGSVQDRLGWTPRQLCAPHPLRTVRPGMPRGGGGWGAGLLAALTCGQHLPPAAAPCVPSQLPRPQPPRSPLTTLVTPGPTPSGAQQDPRPGLTSGFHAGPGALCTGPPPAALPPGPASRDRPRARGGPPQGRGRGLGQAVPGPHHRGRGWSGVVCVRSSAAANKRRRGRATHAGSDGGRGPSGTGLAQGITDV